MVYLSLSLMGPFQAWTFNGTLLPLRTLKERALLAYLAVENGRPQRREALASLFWPDRPDATARNNLRQALYGIRQAIGPAGFDTIFTVTPDEVQMNLCDQFWLDLIAFDLHLRAAHFHHHDQPPPCPHCTQHLRDAVELYQGPFLSDIDLDNSPEFQAWIQLHRQQYFHMQIQSLAKLVEDYEQSGDFSQAAFYARRQIELDDLNESLYFHLMTLLAKTGRIGAALEQYDLYVQKLRKMTGKAPDDTLVTLAKEIREGYFDPATHAPADVPHNLPEHLTPFIGREMELVQISQALENQSVRLISLVGPGGVGKTRLAIQAALINASSFPDGVIFVPLETLQPENQLAEVLAHALGLVQGSQQDILAILTSYLHSRRILLVLDDFEHFIESRGVLLEILKSAPYAKVLLTSRERLLVQAEYLVQLSGLPFPSLDTDLIDTKLGQQEISRTDAMRLMLDRASRVQTMFHGNGSGPVYLLRENESPALVVDQMELEAAARICQMVEGLPLGIELAASWARDFSFVQIAQEMQRNLEFLQASFQDLPERQRSLRASFEHSWELLSESEPEIFCKLAVFPASFSIDASQAVAGAALPWLMRLEDKSLVRKVTFGRYELHPLIRYFTGQKLHQYSRKIEDQTRQQHAQYFCTFLKAREMDLKGARQPDTLDEIEVDLENILAAWEWAVEHQAVALIERAIFSLFYFYESRSRWKEGETRFTGALESLSTDPSPATAPARAYLMAVLGWFCCRLTRFERSEELIKGSLHLTENDEPGEARVFAHFALGFLYTWMSRFQEAWLHLSAANTTAERIDDQWGKAWSREMLTEMAFESGQAGVREEPFLETLAMFERLGEQRGSSRALNYLGNIAMAQRRYLQAKVYFEKMLARVEKLGDVWGMAGGYSKLGELATARGEHANAWRLHQRSLLMLQKMGDLRRSGYAFRELAETAAAMGKPSESWKYFQNALEIADQTRNLPLAVDILTGISAVIFQAEKKSPANDSSARLLQAGRLLSAALSVPDGEQLTLNRARYLMENIQALLPPGEKEKGHQQAGTVWDMVGELLLEKEEFLL